MGMFYLNNRNSYTGYTTSLYWIVPLIPGKKRQRSTLNSYHNTVNCLHNNHHRRPIACPRGPAIVCLLWVQISVTPSSFLICLQCLYWRCYNETPLYRASAWQTKLQFISEVWSLQHTPIKNTNENNNIIPSQRTVKNVQMWYQILHGLEQISTPRNQGVN